jgi:hypothetical protein
MRRLVRGLGLTLLGLSLGACAGAPTALPVVSHPTRPGDHAAAFWRTDAQGQRPRRSR